MRTLIALLLVGAVTVFTFTELHAHQQHKKSQGNGNIVSVDVKFIDGTVHLLLGEIGQSQHHLWYKTSTDQGETWSQPVDAFKGLDLKARMHRYMDVT